MAYVAALSTLPLQSTNPRSTVVDADGKSCWRRVDNEFRGMKKSRKILVNGREIGFYGFDNSAEHLIELDMSQTGIVIPSHNTSFQNLMILKSTFNNYRQAINVIGNETFPSLRILNISHNALDSFDSNLLEHMKEIEILDFSHNCIEHIVHSTVFRLGNIREIHLQHNLIKSFTMWPTHSDAGMYLKSLDISHNELTEFVDSSIIIESLNVAHNKLSSLQIRHASKMNVDASFNQLKSFGERKESTYHHLNLSYNGIESFDDLKFQVATTLDLSHNQCGINLETEKSDEDKSYDSDESINAKRIIVVDLNLSFNALRKVSEISEHFNVKKILRLNNNRLSAIDFELFKSAFSSIQRVSLSGNPLTRADENELKYHNNTQLLSIHFEFDLRTKVPAVSVTSTPSTTTTTTESSLSTTSKLDSRIGNKTTLEKSTSSDCAAAAKAKMKSTPSTVASEPPALKTTSKSTDGGVDESRAMSALLLATVVALMLIVIALLVNIAKSSIRNPHARLIETTNEFENVRIDY